MKLTRKIKKGRKIKKSKSRVKRRTFHKKKTKRYTRRKRRIRKKRGGATFNEQSEKVKVLAAVEHNGYALQYASEKMRGDPDVVIAASIQTHGDALQWATYDLRKDLVFIRRFIDDLRINHISNTDISRHIISTPATYNQLMDMILGPPQYQSQSYGTSKRKNIVTPPLHPPPPAPP